MTVWFAVAVAAAWLLWPARRGRPRGAAARCPAGHRSRTRCGAIASGSRNRPGLAAAGGARARRRRTSRRRLAPSPWWRWPNAIDLLALALRGGVGLLEAVEAVGTRLEDPLGAHLLTVAAAQRWGVDSVEAWASVPSAWQPAARALRMAATAGIAPADVLAQASQEIRRAEEQRLEVATARLGVRVVLPLGLLFLPAFVLTTVVPIVMALAAQVLGQP